MSVSYLLLKKMQYLTLQKVILVNATSRIFIMAVTVAQLVKRFLTFYASRGFINIFTRTTKLL